MGAALGLKYILDLHGPIGDVICNFSHFLGHGLGFGV